MDSLGSVESFSIDELDESDVEVDIMSSEEEENDHVDSLEMVVSDEARGDELNKDGDETLHIIQL